MCGIVGIYNLKQKHLIQKEVLMQMMEQIIHRGPDDYSTVQNETVGLGFRRLSIIDLNHGQQPFYGADGKIVMICNGEIYNHKELRQELTKKGYSFRSNCDVEVIVPLYLEYGCDFISKLNGQFAFALYDGRNQTFLAARDHFGICPFFYTVVNNVFIFGSEIKAILPHPLVKRQVNVTGLDATFSFPGLVSPITMFKGIESLKPGHYVHIKEGNLTMREYWDLDYPTKGTELYNKSEEEIANQLEDLLLKSVRYRLQADVPVGFYLSGGLDSSLVGALMKKIQPDTQYESFSIGFPEASDKEYDERTYQRLMAKALNSQHNEIEFNWSDVDQWLKVAIRHSECPLKETYNTCSLALSQAVRNRGIKVILSGEGSDELLGGYVGYRFDKERGGFDKGKDLSELLESQMREKLWGDKDFFYERSQHDFRETLRSIYSEGVNESHQEIDILNQLPIDKTRLAGRDLFQKRSYVDLKLRLSDHLIADHCDRVTYAHSVEGRYPFLDINLVNFLANVPSEMKLKGLVEKYILKKVAKRYLPETITARQKFSFVAPGSPHLLRNKVEWIDDLLSYERVKRQGYFNPDAIERLKKLYRKEGFKLNLPFDDDLLIVALTFNIFLDVFDMPDF